jgi:hypothetical protein
MDVSLLAQLSVPVHDLAGPDGEPFAQELREDLLRTGALQVGVRGSDADPLQLVLHVLGRARDEVIEVL